nr:hypothetical protein [Tanacetum cinerariifolium]
QKGLISPTYGKSSSIDASQLSDDPDMPELEDIIYPDDDNDVDAKANFNNLETFITVSPIPTIRVHKDHYVSQMIGDLSSTIQTRRGTQEGPLVPNGFSGIKRMKEPLWSGTEQDWSYKDTHRRNELTMKKSLLQNIKKEVYVCQPPGFEDLIILTKSTKWSRHFMVYIKLLELADDRQVSDEFNRKFFLGLQVKKKKDEIFIRQDKYVAEILRKFGLTERKLASTPIDTEKPLLKDPDGEDVDVHT